MIWVLSQSESPWKRNDAITFFLFIFCFSVPGVFLRNRLRENVPAMIASIMAKFEKIYKSVNSKFASKRTLHYFRKKYPEYANNWLVSQIAVRARR